ncbi:MAG: hypothetical protein R2774_13500 [Saprospiraceae bacterium]
MKDNSLDALYSLLQLKKIAPHCLKAALTHESFDNVNEKNTNSKYTFLGMFAVKGIVAQILFDYKAGNGKQMQHTLGNIFTNARMNTLFEGWQLDKFVRFGLDFEKEKHKHIFVFSILGFVLKQYEEEVYKKFFITFLLRDDDLVEHNSQRFNAKAVLAQLMLKSGLPRPQFIFDCADDLYTCSIMAGHKVISTYISKSKHYALKAAQKKAIKSFTFKMENGQAQKEDKSQKHQEWLNQQDKKKNIRDEKAIKRLEEAKQRDIQRRKAKQLKNEKKKETKTVDLSTMNSRKRRFFEDKMK